MKRYVKVLIPSLFILLTILCSFSIYSMEKISSYGQVINYVGIVRGGTQRLIKLEIMDRPKDEMITNLDNILKELTTGEGNIGLVTLNDKEYNEDLKNLNAMWIDLKEMIYKVREDKNFEALIPISEAYFLMANDTVFAAETYSNESSKTLLYLLIFISFVTIITWLFILIGYLKKFSSLESSNRNLQKIAYKDELTGANNLEKFKIDAGTEIRKSKNKNIGIFYVDFVNFKYLNDVFGYNYGDLVLKKYAQFLKEDMGESEVFGRASADNFMVLRHYNSKEEVLNRQKEVDRKITEYTTKSKEKHTMTVSCGICCLEDISEDLKIEEILTRANYAQKTVKNKAKAQYAFYNENIRNQMLKEKTIENEMQEALKNKEFVVYFQPKVNLKTNAIACCEALVRWKSPSKGLISPGDFIPIFEKNLFINQLDQYVFEEVCQWLRKQLELGKGIVPVSVNVSKVQFYNPEFVKSYASIKKKYDISNGLIEIEFTESVAFENLEKLLEIIRELKAEGFKCSLDDFGKGYSSLNMLKNLPVDVLKLDTLFFDASKDSERGKIVINSIISMVKELHIQTVAEGVEHMDQVEFLREIGCDLVQGFVFYKPLPMEEFEKII